MTRKLGSWLIVLVMLAVACGDSGDDSGDASPPVTSEQAQAGTTEPGEPPATTAPEPTTAEPGEPGTSSTTTSAAQEGSTTATRGETGDVEVSEPTVTSLGSEPAEGEPDPGAPLTELPAAKVPRALQPLVDQAAADLAARLGVAVTDINVAVAEPVVWPDGALGCPQPDMAYTQVQVDGVRIVLTHGASTYAYHAGGATTVPFLCEKPA